MTTKQLLRRVPAAPRRQHVVLAICVTALLQAAPGAAWSRTGAPGPAPLDNVDAPYAGQPFFLLADTSFGSQDVAKVRLEIDSPQAVEQAGGVDVRLYRVPQPLAFLGKQRNLHRVQLDAAVSDGLANTLTHVWDSLVVKSRLSWQAIFSSSARQAVTQQAPVLKTPAALKQPSTLEYPAAFRPIAGLSLVQSFRYPLQAARPIAPPKDLRLQGSSSEFTRPSPGNIHVPLGKLQPGLYVVEAAAGLHRATTLIFVSDTVAVTKVSAGQMLVWSTHRQQGSPVAGAQVAWSDGIDVLRSGTTDAAGIVRLDHAAPEQTFVFGQDPAGGVFITENFYYDSEIYGSKLYAVTDRPLYRPGDRVQFKVNGREFRNARDSVALKDGDLSLTVTDPTGQVIETQGLKFSGAHGADGSFQLPDNATAGGYEVQLRLGDETHSAAFRVADYQKPHFEIVLQPAKKDFATGERVTGRLQLNYPDGKPVARARVSLTARAQKLAMNEGDLDYGVSAAIKLPQEELQTDDQGRVEFSLPPASDPSRYLITALATDGAAYRVRTSREILIERGSGSWKLTPARRFSTAGEPVSFALAALPGNDPAASVPRKWEWVRLEDRSRGSGSVEARDTLAVSFPKPGSYTLTLRDEANRVVGATSHWVSGEGAQAPAGHINMVFDRSGYRPGDTAQLLATFPEPVSHALLTLERERVEQAAVTGQRASWVKSERISPTQWKFSLPVTQEMSPNMTVSLAYVKNGDYQFQNEGLLVEQPRVAVEVRPDKASYEPGDTVTLDITTALGGRAVSTDVALSVVDEMIYALQPELAPSIEQFFYQPRRDNVRTGASLAFIGYDLATSKLGQLPSRRHVNERAIKVLERPRRDDVDTAAWSPRLVTDAQGRARLTFRMPDSLTRWRITARAIDANGAVGQQVAWVRSDKALYAKWTSPKWQRQGDKAQAAIAIFNQTGKDAALEWSVTGVGAERRQNLTAHPGVNYVTLPVDADSASGTAARLVLRQDGRTVDQLETPLKREPVAWRAQREQQIDVSSGSAGLKLPADASNVRVVLAQDAAAGEFNRVMDSLIAYPYGCVEQTASRLLPLAIALQSLSAAQQPLAPALRQQLVTARVSLAQMAGPRARFGWWGRAMSDDAFLTAYAYYADWRAAQALGVKLPAEHWNNLLDAYAQGSDKLLPLQQSLALGWMQEMGLPVASMLDAQVARLAAAAGKADAAAPGASLVMTEAGTAPARDAALVLAAHAAQQMKVSLAAEEVAALDAAAARLAGSDSLLVQALLVFTQRMPSDRAAAVLARASAGAATIDRAQALVWLHRALGERPLAGGSVALTAPWKEVVQPSGQRAWQLQPGAAMPATLALPTGAAAAWAFVSYDSSEAQKSALGAQIKRRLWRVVPQTPSKTEAGSPGADGHVAVRLEAVDAGKPLDTNSLYLDELSLTASQPMKWLLLEAALPPGADIERSTWGIDIVDGPGQVHAMERARHESTAQGYGVPVEQIGQGDTVTFRHLVRFSQRGTFKLPPPRAWRMYQPENKAFDTSGAWLSMDVR